ncbi:MAG: hypothetical protein ACQKBW_06385 [Puniceicoccales bacterium]
MSRSHRPRHRVVKTNVRRVVKWRAKRNYAPYIILALLLLMGVLVVLFYDYLR